MICDACATIGSSRIERGCQFGRLDMGEANPPELTGCAQSIVSRWRLAAGTPSTEGLPVDHPRWDPGDGSSCSIRLALLAVAAERGACSAEEEEGKNGVTQQSRCVHRILILLQIGLVEMARTRAPSGPFLPEQQGPSSTAEISSPCAPSNKNNEAQTIAIAGSLRRTLQNDDDATASPG